MLKGVKKGGAKNVLINFSIFFKLIDTHTFLIKIFTNICYMLSFVTPIFQLSIYI